MPPSVNNYDTTLGDQAVSLAKAWHTSDIMGLGTSGGPPNAAASDIEGWGSEQVGASPSNPCTSKSLNMWPVLDVALMLLCDAVCRSCCSWTV